jgi:hypothetical protein
MAPTKRITSIAQVRTMDDRVLTECYVIGIGFSGLTAVSERPVGGRREVLVDLVYVNDVGQVEGETLKARIITCEPRPGAHLLNVAFLKDLRAEAKSPLASYIRRELGLTRRRGPGPPRRGGRGGTA